VQHRAVAARPPDRSRDGVVRAVPETGVVTKPPRHPLLMANEALADLLAGRFEGAVVLIP
jgi:hypothetical protein